jgi:hypothetical protein
MSNVKSQMANVGSAGSPKSETRNSNQAANQKSEDDFCHRWAPICFDLIGVIGDIGGEFN